MSDHLPADLITRILLRLPVDALLRCRCVSRPWLALIDSPSFRKLQIDYSATTGKNAILCIAQLHGGFVFAPYPDGLHRGIGSTTPDHHHALTGGSNNPRAVFSLLGSCNGLLCFARDGEKVVILNPATRIAYSVPVKLAGKRWTSSSSTTGGGGIYPYRSNYKVLRTSLYGFGYDSVSDDYTVVQIVQAFDPETKFLKSALAGYSVRSNSCVKMEFPYVLLEDSSITGVFVSGAIHWAVGRHEPDDHDDDGYEVVIVGYRLELNDFREVAQPDYRDVDSMSGIVIGELGKCLCVFADYEEKFVDVWVMKESWSILFSVPHPGLCYSDGIRGLGFSVTGREVLLQLDGKRLVWYDMKDPKKVAAVEEIVVGGLKEEMDSVVCFGSLVSPYGRLRPVPCREEVRSVDEGEQEEKLPAGGGAERKKKRLGGLSRGITSYCVCWFVCVIIWQSLPRAT